MFSTCQGKRLIVLYQLWFVSEKRDYFRVSHNKMMRELHVVLPALSQMMVGIGCTSMNTSPPLHSSFGFMSHLLFTCSHIHTQG